MTLKILLAIVITACLITPADSRAQSIRIEAENFVDYHDIAINLIQPFILSGCSSGHILYGFDYPDEWVEYDVAVTTFGVYSFTINQKTVLRADYHVQVQLTGGTSGQVQIIDVNFLGTGNG